MWANVTVLLPFAFKGLQEGMGSWFRANHTQDSTNGNSWCGYPYKDYTPGFAIDLHQMTNGSLANWPSPMWGVYASQYCGLQVRSFVTSLVVTLLITFLLTSILHRFALLTRRLKCIILPRK